MTAIGLSDLYFSRHFFPPAVPHLVAHSVVPSIRSDFLSNGLLKCMRRIMQRVLWAFFRGRHKDALGALTFVRLEECE